MEGSKTRLRVEKTVGMEVFCGFAPIASVPVVGRLVGGREGIKAHGACLRVCKGSELLRIDAASDAGIVAVGDCALSPSQLASLSCPILMLPELPERCMGRIAVLDPEKGRLFVSPDLSTVARYSDRLGRSELLEEASFFSTVRTDGVCLSVGQEQNGSFYIRESGCFLDLCEVLEEGAELEELVYERCCDLADLAADGGVAVAVRLGREGNGEDLRAALRGVFRAAVYGTFAVMIGGCLTESNARTARHEYQRAFCELSSEGREFNGYILKGLLLENLLYPLSASSCEGWDFFCLDAKRLSECLTGKPWHECSAWEHEWQTVGSSLLSVCQNSGRLWARMPEPLSPRLLCRAFLQAGVESWIFPSGSGVGTRRYLRDIWESTSQTQETGRKKAQK